MRRAVVLIGLRWFWSLTVDRSDGARGRVATLGEAKAQFQKSWDARRRGRSWKRWRANHDKFLG